MKKIGGVRDTWNYILRRGKEVVYHGISNDPNRRYREHKETRKRFTSMQVIGTAVSRDTALKRERERINKYKRNQGRKPKYNIK